MWSPSPPRTAEKQSLISKSVHFECSSSFARGRSRCTTNADVVLKEIVLDMYQMKFASGDCVMIHDGGSQSDALIAEFCANPTYAGQPLNPVKKCCDFRVLCRTQVNCDDTKEPRIAVC